MTVSIRTVTLVFCDICDSEEEYESLQDAAADAATHDEQYHDGEDDE